MKKFDFSLQKIMNFKEQRLDILMSELQNMQIELDNTDRMIAATNDEYNGKGRELEEKSQSGITKSEMITYNAYLHSLIVRSNELAARRVNIESAMEKKKKDIVLIKSDIKGMEKLKEKQYKEYQKLSQKVFEQEVEDFVVQSARP